MLFQMKSRYERACKCVIFRSSSIDWLVSGWWICEVLTNMHIQSFLCVCACTGSDQWVTQIVFHVKCIWPTHPRGHIHWDTHTDTHTCTVLHSSAETDSEGGRKVNRSLLFFFFFAISFCACSLHLPSPPTVFHSVLNLSAGHSYDTSKSLLLAKCQRMK